MIGKVLLVAGALVAVAIPPAWAAQEHLDIIKQQCGTKLQKPPAVCDCMVTRATDMSDDQQAYIAAQMSGNTAEIGRILPLLNGGDEASVMAYLALASTACSR
jgi:hypothetical protein